MYTRDASPGVGGYYGFQQSRPGAVSCNRSDRLLIAAPPLRGDTNNHDLTCCSCAVLFLVFLVVGMVLLAAQGNLQGRLQGRPRGVVQDVDPAAGTSPPGGNPAHDDALKSESPTSPPTSRTDLSNSSGDIERPMTTVATAEVDKGEPTTLPPPSVASPRFSEKKPETGSGYSAEASPTPSTEVSRGTTGDSVVRIHPLLTDTPPETTKTTGTMMTDNASSMVTRTTGPQLM
ncbi:hypothetical protein MTO96_028919 [Rhipicephalus appendiculatus]